MVTFSDTAVLIIIAVVKIAVVLAVLVTAPRDHIPVRLRQRVHGPDQASIRRGRQLLHGLLRWHRETWMNSLRKDLAFSISQLFCKQFKVTIA